MYVFVLKSQKNRYTTHSWTLNSCENSWEKSRCEWTISDSENRAKIETEFSSYRIFHVDVHFIRWSLVMFICEMPTLYEYHSHPLWPSNSNKGSFTLDDMNRWIDLFFCRHINLFCHHEHIAHKLLCNRISSDRDWDYRLRFLAEMFLLVGKWTGSLVYLPGDIHQSRAMFVNKKVLVSV